MKKQKKLLLPILGIVFLSLGIFMACSTTDNDPPSLTDDNTNNTDPPSLTNDNTNNTDPPLVDTPIDPDLYAEFKNNFVGDYIVDTTAVVPLVGKTMTFNDDMNISATILSESLYLSINFSSSSAGSEIILFTFLEGIHNSNDEIHMQTVIMPATSTNVTLKNSMITTLAENLGQESIIDLTVNPNTGDLLLNNVKIGTKTP